MTAEEIAAGLTEAQRRQWAEELYVRVHNLTGVEAIALIQRAFEERERELREAGKALLAHIGPRDSRVYRTDPAVRRFEAALATRQDAPVTENSDEQ